MIARPVRYVTVGTVRPTQIRDTTKGPVTRSIYRYPSGAGTIELVSTSASTFGSGATISEDVDYVDLDQSLLRYMDTSVGTVVVQITDYES